jgi:hypothetical protein
MAEEVNQELGLASPRAEMDVRKEDRAVTMRRARLIHDRLCGPDEGSTNRDSLSAACLYRFIFWQYKKEPVYCAPLQ